MVEENKEGSFAEVTWDGEVDGLLTGTVVPEATFVDEATQQAHGRRGTDSAKVLQFAAGEVRLRGEIVGELGYNLLVAGQA